MPHCIPLLHVPLVLVQRHLARNCGVAALSRHEVSWLDAIGIPYIAYQHRDPYQPLYYPNRANEAGAYLQFILDFYHCLPKVHNFVPANECCLSNLKQKCLTQQSLKLMLAAWVGIILRELPDEYSTKQPTLSAMNRKCI